MSRADLVRRVRHFVDTSLSGVPGEPFEGLAIDIFNYQRRLDPVAAKLSEEVSDWRDIPAVPVDLFKRLPVGTVSPDKAGAVYRTSGTTRTGRGVHAMVDAELYEHNANRWARYCLGRLPGEHIALLSDPSLVPDASLSHMVQHFRPISEPGETTWHLHEGVLDRAGLNARVEALTGPAFLAATAFALADWLDGTVRRPPPRSQLMVTGGFKGRVHKLDGDQLLSIAAERLGVRVITEYGMTELSSQLWGRAGGPFKPPPWLRPTAVDPVTGAPVPRGKAGQLRFLDLCNVDSAVHIETLDQGIVHDDGAVTLFGRLPGAPARGCSLTVEDAWMAR